MRNHLLTWGVACCALLAASPAMAATVNGSFENGLTGWNTLGTTSIASSSFGIAPTSGASQALVLNSSSSTASSLASFVGISPAALTGAVNGSGLTQSVTVGAGDVLSFSLAFVTNEFVPEPVSNDFAFFSVAGAIQNRLDTFTSGFTIPSATAFGADTGYRSFSYTFATAGTYLLGFGVVNVADNIASSGLLLDNVQITPSQTEIPEPSLLPGFIALGGVAVFAYRRRQRPV